MPASNIVNSMVFQCEKESYSKTNLYFKQNKTAVP